MSYPSTIDTYTPVQGTALESVFDHANMHNTTAGSSVIAIENVLGTTQGTNVLSGFSPGQQAVPIQNGTLGTVVTAGTFQGVTFATISLIGGTVSGVITNNGTITTGVYNGASLGTPIATGAFSNGNISGNGTINWANGDVQYGTLTGNGTFSYTNAGTWQRLTLCLVQNATGGYTITLPASQYPNGVSPSFGTNANMWNAIVVIKNTAGSFLTQSAVSFA